MSVLIYIALTVAVFALLGLVQNWSRTCEPKHRRPGPRHPPGPVPLRRTALPREVLVSTTTAGILFLASLIVALAAVHVPLGDYMYRVYTSDKDSRGERAIYRLIGADPKAEQTWRAYARSVLAFSAVSILFLFIFQLVQGKLPLHLNDPATQMTPALAWNTAVSFVTNTNWQAYSGESTQGHLVQMAGLAV
jgi:potassium-transporting ATPase potassium-binding subunit